MLRTCERSRMMKMTLSCHYYITRMERLQGETVDGDEDTGGERLRQPLYSGRAVHSPLANEPTWWTLEAHVVTGIASLAVANDHVQIFDTDSAHYHEERPHQGVGMSFRFRRLNRLMIVVVQSSVMSGWVGCWSTTTARPHEFFGPSGFI